VDFDELCFFFVFSLLESTLRFEPLYVVYSMLLINAVLAPYPALYDIAAHLAILPMMLPQLGCEFFLFIFHFNCLKHLPFFINKC
jgi:hypothetical protein